MAINNLSDSVPQKSKGVVVEPSPLNHIKLELAVMLCIALMILLLVPSFTDDILLQLLILVVSGMAGAGWLVLRVRKTVAKLTESNNGED